MFQQISRRRLMAGSVSLATLAAMPRLALAAGPRQLTVTRRTLEVNGKAAGVFGIVQPDGVSGLVLDPGQRFQVDLTNDAGEAAIIHWHGMTPPYLQDGVADKMRPLLAAGATASYDFDPRPGTHWMHSHHGLQEQSLMAAPLIVHSAEDMTADIQEVVVLLHDFTFRDPAEILAELTGGAMSHSGHDMSGHDMSGHDMSSMAMPDMAMDQMPMDLNDVEYDAYLANDRTLADPQVVQTERGGRIRLRLINGATTTAFHIDLGALSGTVVAVDGNPVHPVSGQRFPMSMGQRLDILLDLPTEGGAFPILAHREGARQRTGIILASPGSSIAKIPDLAEADSAPLDLQFEAKLSALSPLAAKSPDKVFQVVLNGTMSPYVWSIDDPATGRQAPLDVAPGQRIVIEMVNRSHMAHPMHLHGHHFQVVGLQDRAMPGAMRDTVLVPMGGKVTIAFDADNDGRWPFHCHNLLHMATGMMTEVAYS